MSYIKYVNKQKWHENILITAGGTWKNSIKWVGKMEEQINM